MKPICRRAIAYPLAIAVMTAVAACTSAVGPPEAPTLDVFAPALTTPTLRAATPPAPTAAPECTNDARFVEDLTIPDGENVSPGQQIDKRWSVQNTGTCDWGPDYRLVRISRDAFTGPDEFALYPARAGTDAVWQILLEAPQFLGEHSSRWQAQAPDGSRFGDDVFVDVVVSQ
jgi:hypothetical protein